MSNRLDGRKARGMTSVELEDIKDLDMRTCIDPNGVRDELVAEIERLWKALIKIRDETEDESLIELVRQTFHGRNS